MAITPLYNTQEDLLRYLRLDESNVSEPIIQLGLMEFQIQAMKILGESYSQSLIDKKDNCKVAEYKYIKSYMMLESPTLTIGSNLSSRELWNNESITRESPSGDNAMKMAYRLRGEALNLLGLYINTDGDLDNVVLAYTTPDNPLGDVFDL